MNNNSMDSDAKLKNLFTQLKQKKMKDKGKNGGNPLMEKRQIYITDEEVELYKHFLVKKFLEKWDGKDVKISDLIKYF